MSQNIFRNPFVFQVPYLTGSSVGNGTLTIDRLTHFTVDQKYTAICSAIAPFTVFNIIGEKDGVVGVAVVGQQFTDEDNKIFITIQQGPTLFQVGDTFEFEVRQGTDLNQQNIDTYDELPQKNFGPGITGQNKGDQNIRFTSNEVAAKKTIGDLLFTAVDPGPEGNLISIEYLQGTLLTAATRTIQGLKFSANQAGSAGNNISIEFAEGDPGERASITIQDLDYFADQVGSAGNSISITYISGGTAGAEIVTVSGNAITVRIENGVSTADDIEVALALSSAASALIETVVSENSTGSEPQFVQSQTFLIGGTNPQGDPVEVNGNAIKISFKSGIDTLQEIYNLILLDNEALTLVSLQITGNPDNVLYAPVAPTFLAGGAENTGDPGNEGIFVDGNTIQISHVISTADQIKAAFDAYPMATDLATVTVVGTGSNVQDSPVAKTFLCGGREDGSYGFNKSELSDPSNFHEGNAPITIRGLTNHGDDLTVGNSIKNGTVTLDDDNRNNKSGPAIVNTQKTINNLIQNGKVFLVTVDNSKVGWENGQLSWEADLAFVFPDTGFFNYIEVAQSPFTIPDGEHAFVMGVYRNGHQVLQLQVAPQIPQGENVFRLCSRRGSELIWYDNTLQKDKRKIRIGEGGGGTAYQEKLGTGNGSGKNFPLTFIPSNEFSILVICSYTRSYGTDYTYNPIGNQIEFVNAPAAGQDVYVFYLTDGDTISVPTPDGLLNSYVHTVSAAEELAKEITLSNIPASPAKALIDVLGGGPLEYNFHYNISVNKFQWSGYGLDGLLAQGDKLRFYFYS